MEAPAKREIIIAAKIILGKFCNITVKNNELTSYHSNRLTNKEITLLAKILRNTMYMLNHDSDIEAQIEILLYGLQSDTFFDEEISLISKMILSLMEQQVERNSLRNKLKEPIGF